MSGTDDYQGIRARSGLPGFVRIKVQSGPERHGNSPVLLFATAVFGLGSCISYPAFGAASRPRSVHFPEGLGYRNREEIAPPENDLGGLRRWPRLDCRRLSRGEPGQAFFATMPVLGGMPDEEGLTPHPRRRGVLLVILLNDAPCNSSDELPTRRSQPT